MTKPSPQDDLPPGPWTYRESLATDYWIVENAKQLIACEIESKPIARAIAAIPEMRVEIDRLFADLTQMTAMQDATHKFRVAAEQENDRLREENASLRQESVQYAQEANRLRAEKAELLDGLQAIWPWFAGEHYYDHPDSVKVRAIIGKYAQAANETEGK
jgi:FtsZ-binding cell division protein ZapB